MGDDVTDPERPPGFAASVRLDSHEQEPSRGFSPCVLGSRPRSPASSRTGCGDPVTSVSPLLQPERSWCAGAGAWRVPGRPVSETQAGGPGCRPLIRKAKPRTSALILRASSG